jgi:predicted nucleic acid-binding protein
LIHLDTNFLIQAERSNTPAAHAVAEWLREGALLRASLLVWAEYLCGADHEPQVRHWQMTLDGFEPLTESRCQLAAQLQRRNRGGDSRLIDCLIAACAIDCGAALATINRRDFECFTDQGLELAMDDWRSFPTASP